METHDPVAVATAIRHLSAGEALTIGDRKVLLAMLKEAVPVMRFLAEQPQLARAISMLVRLREVMGDLKPQDKLVTN